MITLYTLIVLIIYISIILILEKINFNEKIKRNTFIILSTIYNGFMGYIDTIVVLIIYGYFANMPKGSGYEIPESEIGFNFMIGIITLIIYLMLLIPINIYIQKKGKINLKFYTILNTLATILGIIIFWIFLDKSKQLF